MNWIQDLLTNPDSIAHIVALYSFVIAVGVLLGKIKIFGISLGVTFVLFVGILAGHFGFTGNQSILSFLQDFGLILFVFCIGLQVGPSFFSSFKKGGIRLNMLAVGIVALNIAVAIIIYYALQGRVEIPMMVGILCGGCCQRSFAAIRLSRAGNSYGICLCLSFGCYGYHSFTYSYPLYLSGKFGQRS